MNRRISAAARSLSRRSAKTAAPTNALRRRLEALEDRTVPTAVAAPSGLVSWWTADNTAADLMNRNNATMFNGATFASGMVGQAFSVDGIDDSVQAADSDSLELSESLTIEAWVLVDSFPPVNAIPTYIFFRGDDRGGLDPFHLAVNSNGELLFGFDTNVETRTRIRAPIALGQFIHVAGTLDDATGAMRLYQNGDLVAEQFTTLRPFRDLEPTFDPGMGIGATQDGGGQRFDGLIDDLSLYNRALTAAEVQGIYAAGSDGKIRMVVAKTNPDLGTTVTTAPTSFVVDFSYAYDPASVHADDFTVNGISATSVQFTDNDTATFTFATSPVTAEGVQTMHMDTGAVTRFSGNLALAVYDGQFTFDQTTKFYVVDDSSANRTFEYIGSGNATESYALSNSAPRGAASTVAGDRVWVIDANRQVYIYNTTGALLGSWTAGSLSGSAQLEGITTDGTDIWLIDAKQDKVFRYANAASRISGSQNAASSFSLNNANKNPKDLVTDGTSIWVIEDSGTDKVFKYTLSGSLLGSWTLTSGGGSPTGITLDPSNDQQHLWIVDNATDRVYQYEDARSRTSGSQWTGTIFSLVAGNTNPQGIADPPAVGIGDATAVEGSPALKFIDRFVAAGSGGVDHPGSLVFGPDANLDGMQELYVAGTNSDAVHRYDGRTGSFIDMFIASGSGGLSGPRDLIFGPDGHLYVSSELTNQVLRYDGVTGDFLGIVASGLSSPQGLMFGSDGSLYIADRGADQVLRYRNGSLTVFISAGSGGLDMPQRAIIGPDGNGDGVPDLYVTSWGPGRVFRYHGLTGSFLDTFAVPPPGMPGSFSNRGIAWMEFATDGYLYTTARTTADGFDTSIMRFSAVTGAFVDTFSLGRDGWSFLIGPDGLVYDSANGGGNFVERFGHASLAAFTVTLDTPSASPVTVQFATAPGTALAGSDFTATNGTLTFAPGQTTRTILVRTLDDALHEGTENFVVNLSNPVGATISDGQAIGTITDNDSVRVAATTINDGSAQRSRVLELTVTFSTQVTFAGGNPAGAFTLIRNGGKPVTFSATSSVVNGVTVVKLLNFSGASTQFGSLADGRYTLTVIASQISANGQQMTGNYTFGDAQGLFRMYGDVNGDQQVDGADFSAFSYTYASFANQSNYLWFLDINGDGQIDGVEFSQFSGRFNTLLP